MKYLFFCPYGSYRVHNQVDAILGLALKVRGHETMIATCDGIFRDCEVLHWDPPQTRKLGCQTCRNTGADFFKIFGHNPTPASTYLTLEDGNAADQWLRTIEREDYTKVRYQNYELGEWSTSSIITCFKAAISDLARPDIRALHRTYLRSSFLVAKLFERMIANFKPDRVICFNGRMYPYRVAMEVSRLHGIDVLVHERGNSDDRFNFALNNRTYDSQHVINFIKNWMETPLSEAEISRVIEHYRAREIGKDSNLPGFHRQKGDQSTLRGRLNIPPEAKITGFFTSSEFELNKFDGFVTKFSQLDVLKAVIEAFKRRADYLVIRHHPFLIGSKENPPNSTFISELMRFADACPQNVRVIMPQDEINTYDILPHLSGCIAPWSSVAMESAFRGIASAVLPESHISPAAFRTISEISVDAFQTMLDQMHAATAAGDIEIIRKCLRFGFSYIGRMDIQFKSFGISNSYESVIKFCSAEQLLPGNDPELDQIVTHLTSGVPLHRQPVKRTSSERLKDLQLEEQLIQRFRDEIIAGRAKLVCKPAKNAPKISILALTELSDSLVYKQRIKNTSIIEVASSQSIAEAVKAALPELLKQNESEYFYIAARKARYDENFLSTMVEALQNSGKGQCFCGAWLLNEQNNICGEFLTRRHTLEHPSDNSTFREITEAIAPALLSQFIFKQSALVKAIEELQRGTSIANILRDLLGNSETLHLPGPYISLDLH